MLISGKGVWVGTSVFKGVGGTVVVEVMTADDTERPGETGGSAAQSQVTDTSKKVRNNNN